MSTNKQNSTSTMTRGEDPSVAALQIQQLFKVMVESGASDLHITVGTAPGMRISGDMVRVKVGALGPDDTKRLVYQILTEKQKEGCQWESGVLENLLEESFPENLRTL